jgi:hypothetical protein
MRKSIVKTLGDSQTLMTVPTPEHFRKAAQQMRDINDSTEGIGVLDYLRTLVKEDSPFYVQIIETARNNAPRYKATDQRSLIAASMVLGALAERARGEKA